MVILGISLNWSGTFHFLTLESQPTCEYLDIINAMRNLTHVERHWRMRCHDGGRETDKDRERERERERERGHILWGKTCR